MQALAARFIPAADEVWLLQHGKGAESELFLKFAEKGHYGGRTRPTDTRQGIYCATPSGEFLSSLNHNDPRRVEAALRQALAAWEAMPREKRLRPEAPAAAPEGRFRWETLFPADGLSLRVFVRDLPREGGPKEGDWRTRSWNQDSAWFRKEEARSFLPEKPAKGAVQEVPAALVRRLARCHLLDFVRGQTPVLPDAAVEKAVLRTEVLSVEGDLVVLRLSGETRTVHRGHWAVAGFKDMEKPSEQERGYEATLLGKARFDLAAGRFTEFELVASGDRWGATQYNGRTDDPGPAPMGFVLTLDIADPPLPVAPAQIGAYGWRR